MEGKNVAFGAPGSSLFAASTTVTSTGSVNSFHDSFTPFGGGIALFDIALEQASRMFVPFQRLGDTDNTTGIGLGLALSRGLTEAMDGTLEPEDTPGGGLTIAPAAGRSRHGARCPAGPTRRSSCCRVAPTAPTRSRRSTPAPTTTSPSPSGWTNCWPGCAVVRRSAAEASEPRVTLGDLTIDLAAKRARRDGEDIRLTPTEWHLLEVLRRHPGKLLSRRQLLHEVWGPGYADATENLRLYMAQLRRKLEPDPARPRWLVR